MVLFFRRCFFRLEWGDGGGPSLGLELSTSVGSLAGEGEVETCGKRGEAAARGAVLPRSGPRLESRACALSGMGLCPGLPSLGPRGPSSGGGNVQR